MAGGCGPSLSDTKEVTLKTASSYPFGVACDDDGNVWIAQANANMIEEQSPSDGSINDRPIPTDDSGVRGIAFSYDSSSQRVWFTESAANRIGTISQAGPIVEYPLPHADSEPFAISGDGFNGVWFTELRGNRIGHITNSGVITEYNIPTPDSYPNAIDGSRGDLWFTEGRGNRVGMMSHNRIVEIALPHPNSRPSAIAAQYWGTTPTAWFAEESGRIGRVDVNGHFTEYDVPGKPDAIGTGPGLTLWYADGAERTITGVSASFEASDQPQDFSVTRPFQVAASGEIANVATCKDDLWATNPQSNSLIHAKIFVTQSL